MNTSWRRRAATRPKAVEATALVLLFALTVAGVLLTRTVMAKTPALWPGVALAAVGCGALVWRRDRPLYVLATALLCTMAQAVLGYLLTPG
ncbi:hypothetical protein QBA54_09645 [Streptomyces sp. B21-108]